MAKSRHNGDGANRRRQQSRQDEHLRYRRCIEDEFCYVCGASPYQFWQLEGCLTCICHRVAYRSILEKQRKRTSRRPEERHR